jgi:hypothetical protein
MRIASGAFELHFGGPRNTRTNAKRKRSEINFEGTEIVATCLSCAYNRGVNETINDVSD